MKRLTDRILGRRRYAGGSAILLAALVFAQQPAYIAGRVTDSKGLPIPAASVRISTVQDQASTETLTEIDGTFAFRELPPGVYRLEVEIVGFLKSENAAVDATAEASRNLVIQLQPVPPPPRTPLSRRPAEPVPARSAESFETAQVTELPGLNLFQDQSTQEEVSGTARSRPENLLVISGNTASLDAGNIADPRFRQQMTDNARMMGFQIAEFQQPEAGRGSGGDFGPGGDMGGAGRGGGGQAGFMTMGGRGRGPNFRQPKIQGMVSETFSNSALNARNYSLSGQSLPKPVQIQNNYTVTIGGALPFFKTQTSTRQGTGGAGGPGGRGGGPGGQPAWFFSYGGNRNRSPQDILTTVPTDLERSGDFSQSYIRLSTIDAATGRQDSVVQPVQLYRNAQDSSSRFTRVTGIDPVAAQLLQFVPRANLPCASNAPCVNNYAIQRSLPTTSDQIQASVMGLRVTSKDTFGANYNVRRGNSLAASIFPGLDSTRTNFAQNVGISGVHTFGRRLMADWRIGLNRTHTESTNAFAYEQDVEGNLGITGVSREPTNWGIPTINFTNYGNLSLAAPSLNRNQTFTVSGAVHRFAGRHSVQVGTDFNRGQHNTRSDSNGRGTFTFTGYATVLLDAQGRQVAGTGYDLADFLLALPYSTSRSYVDPAVNPYGASVYLRNRAWSVFAMDDWRVRANLTLNYGIRYEYTGPSYERYDRLVSLDATSGFTAVAQVFPNQTGPLSGQHFSRALVNPDKNNWAPRIGVAWKPSAQSRLVVRAGYGIGYNPSGYASIANRLVNQAPFAVTQDIVSDRSNPLTLRTGFTNSPSLAVLNTYAIDPNYRAGCAQQWSLDIQRQISQLYVVDITYSGARGTGLDIMRAPSRTGDSNHFIFQTNGASSIYHGLNVQLMRRFSRGFNVMNLYTFSKNIDDSSGSGASVVAQNDADLAAERSLSSQDQRHRFQANVTYDLPFGQNRLFLAGASSKVLNFVSGWSFFGNFSMASGSPLTARYVSGNGSSAGAALYNSLRPDATGVPANLAWADRSMMRFFDTAAFTIPAGLYGSAGRNTITGPGTILLNLSVHKNFRLDENNRRIDFSWQVQNLLNHPNWRGVSTTINALNFGQVTSVQAMRSMTMNLRINF
jgi:trimeric autotransporter adhesin